MDSKIHHIQKTYIDYLSKIYINKSFYLNACKPDEIYDIILSFDIKKSLGPNSIHVYLFKI